MESDSDGEPLEADYSSMKQPPLIKQLRGILSEYPDGGQIIKELLQNAEDAGASEVSLLYESRRINRDNVKGKPYRKFFQGPALCLYNNAVFTEQDWEGIQMIYSSVKEDDRQKVGRFGLGFKSVFHITDYPCVISGDRVLCVDPQQSSDKVNASMKLSKLTRYKKFDYEAFMIALDGTFNIDRNISTQGNFTGTIFWFPLREEVSPISETLYNEEKVMSLFNVFKNEAENILIFLRSLTSISLNMKESDKSIQKIAKVKLAENIEEVTEKRLKFKSDISQLQNDYIGKDIQTTYTMTIHTFLKDKGSSTKRWMIVNMFIGENASSEFRALIQDPSNGNSPYVGVAVPLLQGSDHREPLEGHVYCFLPLPKEGSRLTGLPVHINGFFALNQSRHHLKWQTDEQAGMAITDKDILWNKFLIIEALPLAYEILIKRMTENGHPENAVPVVYDAIPNLKHVKDKWKPLVIQLMTKLVKDCPFLYFIDRNNPPTKSWLTVKEARFATFGNLPETNSNVKDTIIKTLLHMGVKYVDVPIQVFDSINNCLTLEDLSPARFSDLLRHDSSYKGLLEEEKVDILDYLTSDNDINKLSGLELLPVASGSWISFNDTFEVVNACSETDMQLFPGLEEMMLQRNQRRCASLDTHLRQSGTSGMFQIRQFNSESFKVMLRETVRLHLIDKGLKVIAKCTPLTYAWLKKVWEFIFNNEIVDAFEDTPLVPKLKIGDWTGDNIEMELHCLKDVMLLEHHNGIGLPTGVTEAIRCLSVEILPSLPDWFTTTTIQKYISMPTPESIVQMLSKLKLEKDTRANCFNSKCSYDSKESFVAYISNVSVFHIDARDILKQLTIFRQFESPTSAPAYVSLLGNNRYIQENDLSDFPISYPYPVICASPQTEKLLSSLDASKVDLTGIVLNTVEQIIQGKRCETDVVEFMKYFLTNYHKFENHRQIVDLAKKVEFLKSNSRLYKPSDLFNHFENDLLHLFIGETKFPEQTFFRDDKYIHILKRLGLKSIGDVDANDLLEVAETLDRWSESGPISLTDIETKAHTFLQFLNRKPELLQCTCKNGTYLSTCIEKKKCIKLEHNRNSSFPTCLPWYKSPSVMCRPNDVCDIKYCLLVGSTMPLFSPPNNLSNAFHWNGVPPEENILDQLQLVKQIYLDVNQTEMLTVVKSIYSCMASTGVANQKTLIQQLASRKLVWNGDGFCEPTIIFISHHDNDLDLRPYFHRCPNEFLSFEEFYKSMGCFVEQSVNVLLKTLQQIKEKHECRTCNEHEVEHCIAIAGAILDRLAEHKHELVGSEDAILVPVQTVEDTSKYGRLTMKNVKECVYDKENLGSFIENEDDGKQYYVHEDIKCETARTLGVKSVNIRALSDTEGFERWGQDEPLTARISTLLREGYVDGLSVPKELMQNADDAGASTIKFLYDERTNDDAKQKLLSSDMKECQGPSLWVYNDATFSAEDLINITKLNGATKQNDAKSIGKFGLGFCSVYNLTDVPSFVTGNNIVMFDPHMTYLQDALPDRNTPGLRIDLTKPKNRNLLRRHCDQFKPYEGIFNCKMSRTEDVVMKGTLFRFPLRTAFQSQTSQISSTSYSRHEMIELLRLFVQSAGNLFLFTQNVKTLEIYNLPSTATSVSEASLLFAANHECLILEANQMNVFKGSVLERAHMNVKNDRDEDIIQKRNITLTITENGRKLIDGLGDIKSQTVSPWLVAWSTGKSRLNLRASLESAIALSAIAIPCRKTHELLPEELQNVETGFYRNGHIFCFLPMPLTTDLPLHINGYFDVTSDRRQLLSLTEDDKGSKHYEWNTFLMSESLVHSFLILLQMLAMKATDTYVYHCLWPANINTNETSSPFKVNFYKKIVYEDIRLFKINSKWLSFNDVVFLDANVKMDQEIGHVAYEMLQTFNVRDGKTLVDLPVNVLMAMQKSTETDGNSLVVNSIVTSREMLIVALQNIKHVFWNEKQKERDALILRALLQLDDDIKGILQTNECIPVEPNGVLRKPSDIINPTSDVCHMFNESDGRFLTNNPEFKNQKVIGNLKLLGMIDSLLPGHILIERCDSIKCLAQRCCQCAYERSWHLIKHVGKTIVQESRDEETMNIIKTKYILPVLVKPTSWQFQWQSDRCKNIQRIIKTDANECTTHLTTLCTTILLGQASQLYRRQAADFIGTVENVIDESGLLNNESGYGVSLDSTFTFLGVKEIDVSSDKNTENLVEQLVNISNDYRDIDAQFTEITRIFPKIFEELNSYLGSNNADACLKYIKTLQSKKVVLIGNALVLPKNVALSVKEICPPDLLQLPTNDKRQRKRIYNAIGVNDTFSVADIIDVLRKKKEIWKENACSEIDVINNLLINLEACMVNEDLKYSDLQDEKRFIVCPDVNGVLRPTYELIIDDENYQTSSKVHIVHDRVVPKLVCELGVKPKDKKCLEEISFGVPFGQKEKLQTRIKTLLSSYPCDSSIMKELLQNADDAGASEIHFITDFRTHAIDPNFEIKKFQGPSLCVFNNSYFTESDFEGILNLGEGSKGDDPTKTGQYGVGFNSVYHITDTPSFLTKGPGIQNGGNLCIFDPLLCHVPHVTEREPGMRYEVNGLQMNFPNILLGFTEFKQLFPFEIGTLFRLPLRSERSTLSEKILNKDNVYALLESFKDEMFDALLFVKNIKCIKISDVDISSGKLMSKYEVRSTLSDQDGDERKRFFANVNETVKRNKNNKGANLKLMPTYVSYKLSICDCQGKTKDYFVVQGFGFNLDEHIQQQNVIQEFTNGNIGYLPLGGVAMPLEVFRNKQTTNTVRDQKSDNTSISDTVNPSPQTESDGDNLDNAFIGKAFCFLPLPISTGLPVHINGHFALDHESRRHIWESGFRHEWNVCIVEFILVPAYIMTLEYVQSFFIQPKLSEAMSWSYINEVMKKYHFMFPILNPAKDDFWKGLVSSFYKIVLDKKLSIFPVVQTIKSVKPPKHHFDVTWTNVTHTTGIYAGIFDDIHTHIPIYAYDRTKRIHIIGDVLRRIGMKIIHTPKTVLKTIRNVGFDHVKTTSPLFVIEFVKSFEAEGTHTCKIGGIDKELEKTNIKDGVSLLSLVYYSMLAEKFQDQYEGIPFLLTADNFLRQFSTSESVYNSEYWTLFPSNHPKFVHEEEIVILNKPELFAKGILQPFGVQECVSMLGSSMNANIFANGTYILWNKETKQPVSPDWIRTLFEFVYSQSISETTYSTRDGSVQYLDSEKFIDNLNSFSTWSFLPSLQIIDNVRNENLVPLSHSHYLIKKSIGNNSLDSIVEKMNLPMLDESVFENDRSRIESSKLIRGLHKVISSFDKPEKMLECFLYYYERIVSSQLGANDSISLLAFFSQHIDSMKETMGDSVKTKLRRLPFFLTQQKTLVDVTSDNILVLFKGMPSDGIGEWADKTGCILLQQNDTLDKIYKFIGLSMTSTTDIYIDKILPHMDALPRKYWITHVQYMRDYLLNKGYNKYSKQQNTLLQQLSCVAFLDVHGQNKRVNELYDNEHAVFAVMLDDTNFPPTMFRGDAWKSFFVELGLICAPDPSMFIKFARRVESMSKQGISNALNEKSNVLVDHFLSNHQDFDNSTLEKIGHIRFIIPHSCSDYLCNIYKKLDINQGFICFDKSVSSAYETICWTSTHLLPRIRVENINMNRRNILGILKIPPMDKVISHCQNICTALESRLSNKSLGDFNITEQMEDLYQFLKSNMPDSKDARKRLGPFPMVYIPEEKTMVKASDVVIGLSPKFTVKPFLFNAPTYFGKFNELFQILGSQTEVNCVHYSYILTNLKQKLKETEPILYEMGIIRRVLKLFCKLLQQKKNKSGEIERLYLPNENGILVESKELVLLDNALWAERIHGKTDIMFFAGFAALNLNIDIMEAFKNLSDHIKPKVLSKIITEEIALDKIHMNNNSRNAGHLEDFIHSTFFIQGILRLMKHYARQLVTEVGSCAFDVTRLRLQNVSIRSVTGLKTVLKYKGNVVEGSEGTKHCVCIEETVENEQRFVLYFEDQDNAVIDISSLVEEEDGLLDLINKCVETIKIPERNTTMILRLYNNPTEISKKLDRLKIDAYELPLSMKSNHQLFPLPGTYVDERFHPFLESGLSLFKIHEFKYIAMELEDSCMDCDDESDQKEPVYIYVRIIKDLHIEEESLLKKQYLVDTGTDNLDGEIVPLYRLYRFVRNDDNLCTNITAYNDEPVGCIPFDNSCRRIRDLLREAWNLPEIDRRRVIRRLWLKWHPDKNPGNKEYATRVFNYMQDIILKLENGEILDEDVDTTTGQSAPDLSRSSYCNMGGHMNRRAESYSRAFRDNVDDYNRATSSGRYAHADARRQVRPDHGEAQRWLRQAKCDFKAAETSLEDMSTVQGYNWICYMCHQASEKALKAACFSKDGNSVSTHTHSLALAAMGLTDGLLNQARSLEQHLGEHTRMRYPDRHSRPDIPSTVYNEDHATKAISIAKVIVDLAEEYIV